MTFLHNFFTTSFFFNFVVICALKKWQRLWARRWSIPPMTQSGSHKRHVGTLLMVMTRSFWTYIHVYEKGETYHPLDYPVISHNYLRALFSHSNIHAPPNAPQEMRLALFLAIKNDPLVNELSSEVCSFLDCSYHFFRVSAEPTRLCHPHSILKESDVNRNIVNKAVLSRDPTLPPLSRSRLCELATAELSRNEMLCSFVFRAYFNVVFNRIVGYVSFFGWSDYCFVEFWCSWAKKKQKKKN